MNICVLWLIFVKNRFLLIQLSENKSHNKGKRSKEEKQEQINNNMIIINSNSTTGINLTKNNTPKHSPSGQSRILLILLPKYAKELMLLLKTI